MRKIIVENIGKKDLGSVTHCLLSAGIPVGDIDHGIDIHQISHIEAIGTDEQIDEAEQLLINAFFEVKTEEV